MRRLLLIGVFSLTLSTAPVDSQTLATGQPVVLDANGVVVGPVQEATMTAFGDTFQTTVFVDDRPVFLFLEADRSVLTSVSPGGFGAGVIFESNDCTGQGYLDLPGPDPTVFLSAPSVALNSPGLSIWVPTMDSGVPGLMIESFLDNAGICSSIAPTPDQGVPAIEVATPYVGPYSLGREPTSLGAPLSVPAVGRTGLALLACALFAAGWWLIRR